VRRREFLIGAAAAASSPFVGRAQDSKEAKLARVSIMSGGFGRLIPEVWDRSQPVAPKQLEIMDLPQLLADRFGLHNVEVQQIHFLSMEPSYYAKFNEKLKQAKCKVSNMPLELDDHGYAGIVGPSSPDIKPCPRLFDSCGYSIHTNRA